MFSGYRSPHDYAAEPYWQGADSRIEESGIEVLRVKGSHHFLRHDDGRSTVVPVHTGEDIGPGLFAKILRDCELSRAQFQNFL